MQCMYDGNINIKYNFVYKNPYDLYIEKKKKNDCGIKYLYKNISILKQMYQHFIVSFFYF